MRILVLSTLVFPDSLSGSARHLTEVSARLAGRGHAVDVLTRRESLDQPAESEYRGLRIVRYGDPRLHRLTSKSMTEVADVYRALPRAATRGRYDLVMGHHCTPTYGAVLRRLGLPLVYQFHASTYLETVYRGAAYYERLGGPLSRVKPAAFTAFAGALKRVEGSVLDAADRVLVLSRFSEEILRDTYPGAYGKHEIIPGGVDGERFHPAADRGAVRRALGVADDERLILTVRRLVPRMGLAELIEAVAGVRERLGKARLVIVGAGPLDADLRRRAQELGVEDMVTFAGLVPEDDLPRWYQAADLFVLPTQAYEGFGMVTPEALASGTPVVATRAGATPELLEDLDPRLLTDGLSPERIGAAIVRFVEEVDAPGLRERCRAYCEERFAWPAVIDRYEDVLDRVLARGPRRPPRVALVGPRPDSNGGVGAMVRLIGGSGLGGSYRLVTVATYRDGSRPQKLLQAARGLARLAVLSAGRRVDIVHLHTSWDASFSRKATATAICRVLGRPVVLHVHGGRLAAEMSRPGLRGAGRRRVVRWTLSTSRAVVALTPGWADQIAEVAGRQDVHVVPNAPDLRAAVRHPAERPTILFLGHLYPEKGIFELVDAFARLRADRPGLRLVMAGEGTHLGEVRAAAARHGIGDEDLALPGWVGPEAKAELLATATCFALPSYTEGLPLALLEAMAAGLPVVVTSVGGIPEVVRDGEDGLLIPPRDTDALAAALARLIDDPALAGRLADAALARARAEYSPEALARRVGAIYEDVLEAR